MCNRINCMNISATNSMNHLIYNLQDVNLLLIDQYGFYLSIKMFYHKIEKILKLIKHMCIVYFYYESFPFPQFTHVLLLFTAKKMSVV